MAFRRAFIVGVVLACATLLGADAVPPQHKGTPPGAVGTRFKFAILSDRWGGQPKGATIFDEAVREINGLDPDFTIGVGDLLNGKRGPRMGGPLQDYRRRQCPGV